jgi:hypothetical protein
MWIIIYKIAIPVEYPELILYNYLTFNNISCKFRNPMTLKCHDGPYYGVCDH